MSLAHNTNFQKWLKAIFLGKSVELRFKILTVLATCQIYQKNYIQQNLDPLSKFKVGEDETIK